MKIKHKLKLDQKTEYQFFPSKEHLIEEDKKIHYYIASYYFHKMLSKITNKGLPKKLIINPCDAIESITYINNEKLETDYAVQKEAFKQQNKVDQQGEVAELFLFHGTSFENIDSIITNNFLVDHLPHQQNEVNGDRKKAMLFGRGIYFSELPDVSLMYGSGLLLCKVLVGSCEMFQPRGEIPPGIPDTFDSREVIKDGVGIVHVVKKPSQILPYCVIKLKQESISSIITAHTIQSKAVQIQPITHECFKIFKQG